MKLLYGDVINGCIWKFEDWCKICSNMLGVFSVNIASNSQLHLVSHICCGYFW